MTVVAMTQREEFDPKDFIQYDFETPVEQLDDEDLAEDLEAVPQIVAIANEHLFKVRTEVLKRNMNPLEGQSDDTLADRRKAIADEIAVLQRQEEALKAERDSIDQEFKDRFNERGTEGTKTSRFTLSLITDDAYPMIEDRTAFEDYILKTGDLHLLQKRPAINALKEELSIKQVERANYEQRLDDANWDSSVCEEVLRELSDGDIENRLTVLRLIDGGLKTATQSALEEKFSVPGIAFKKNVTLRQVKRGNKV